MSPRSDNEHHDLLDEGLQLLKAGDFWEAHEAWEDLWQALPRPSAARRATKALIQFAAICYKPEQAASGRPAEGMQRGMNRLLDTARSHLDDSNELPAPEPRWDRTPLREALDDIDEVLDRWRDGHDLAAVRRAITDIVETFGSEFTDAGARG